MALALGEWDVDGLYDLMPATLFDRWKAYYEAEPWGLEVDDLHTGHIVSTLINLKRKKGAKALLPHDCRLFKEPKEPQTVEEQKAAMMRVAARLGAEVPTPPP